MAAANTGDMPRAVAAFDENPTRFHAWLRAFVTLEIARRRDRLDRACATGVEVDLRLRECTDAKNQGADAK